VLRRILATLALKVGYVPYRYRWKVATKGVGVVVKELHSRFHEEYGPGSLRLMRDAFYDIGREQGRLVKDSLGELGGVEDSAAVLCAVESIWGMDVEVERTEDGIETVVTDCEWNDLEGWGPGLCSTLVAYERGVLDEINPDMELSYPEKRSLGHGACRGLLREVKGDDQ